MRFTPTSLDLSAKPIEEEDSDTKRSNLPCANRHKAQLDVGWWADDDAGTLQHYNDLCQ